MKRRPATRRSSPALRPGAAACVALAFLSACANWPAPDDGADSAKALRNSLPVAAAALSAGQVDVAQRLYTSLSDQFDDAPEPRLGLGYIAFRNQDFVAAEKHFLQAAKRADETPEILAEALMGAGRAALVQGRSRAATKHLRRALESGKDTSFAAWIANGLAVAAALDADYDAAEAHYATAIQLSSGHPRIAANHVRMLVAAGRIDDAARAFARHPPTYWTQEDGPELSRIVDEAQREQRLRALARPAAPEPDPEPTPTATTRSGRDAGERLPPPDPARAVPTVPAAPAAPAAAEPVHALRLHPVDHGLVLRLYVPDPAPAAPGEEAPAGARRLVSVDASGLLFRIAGLPDPWTGTPAADGAGGASTTPGSAVPGASSLAAMEAGAATATVPAPAPASPEPAASEPGAVESPSPVPAPESAAMRPDAHASRAESAATTRDPPAESPALRPARSGAEPAFARTRPPSTATPEATRAHPLPESEIVTGTGLDATPPTTLSVPVGQSRRVHLENPATTVLVAAPEVADVQLLASNVLYVIGKTVGRTSVAVLADNDLIEEQVVAVVLDLEPLRTILAGEPDLIGVRASRLSRGIALTGEVVSAAAADRALRLAIGALPDGVPIDNQLAVAAPQQVNLEVLIAEVSRRVTEDLGINWEAFGVSGTEQLGFRVGTLPVVAGAGLAGDPPFVNLATAECRTDVTAFEGGPASSIFLSSKGPWRGQFRAIIDALATAGLANVLARPNVTAISGEPASFFSGGEFPLPGGFDDGVLTFEFKKYGRRSARLRPHGRRFRPNRTDRPAGSLRAISKRCNRGHPWSHRSGDERTPRGDDGRGRQRRVDRDRPRQAPRESPLFRLVEPILYLFGQHRLHLLQLRPRRQLGHVVPSLREHQTNPFAERPLDRPNARGCPGSRNRSNHRGRRTAGASRRTCRRLGLLATGRTSTESEELELIVIVTARLVEAERRAAGHGHAAGDDAARERLPLLRRDGRRLSGGLDDRVADLGMSRGRTTRSSVSASRSAVSASNFRAACRHSSARSAARPRSMPRLNPLSSASSNHSFTRSASIVCTSSSCVSRIGRRRLSTPALQGHVARRSTLRQSCGRRAEAGTREVAAGKASGRRRGDARGPVEQDGAGVGLDDRVADLGDITRSHDAVQRLRKPFGRFGIELPRRLPAQQRP